MTRWLAVSAAVVVLLPVVLIGAAFGALTASTAPAVAADVPPLVLDAYRRAAARSLDAAGCQVPWSVLAGIGYVETRHAAGVEISPDGDTVPAILGLRLDGTNSTATIADTDAGRLDGDATWDRAAGLMQFLPASWQLFGRDGNGDGVASPHNVYDAALAAAVHLCHAPPPTSGGKDVAEPDELTAALYAYNGSATYVDAVLAAIARYDAITDATVVGGYALPVARDLLTPPLLAASHHDYPAWDLAVPVGTTVYAVHGGTVTAVTSGGRCGRGVIIAGDDGYAYTYCHASVVTAAAGEAAQAGQPILASGNSGNSTGPHLHLGIRRPDGRSVCPQPLLAAWYRGLPAHPATAPTSGCTH